MGGFTGGGGETGGPGPGPEVPVPDFVAQAKQTAEGYKQAGMWGSLWASFWGHLVDGANYVVILLSNVIDSIVSGVIELFSAVANNKSAGFFALVAALLGDLLGTDVDRFAITAAFQQHGQQASLRQIGGTVFDQIAKDLGSGASLSPESGEAAAKAWLGFLIEFSVRQGNISFIQSVLPLEWFGGIREYGEMLQRSLGLGRLARQAFTPLMKVLIADPLTWKLNRQYHPARLSAAEAVRAANRGLIDATTLQRELDYAGYSQDRQDVIQAENLVQLAAAETYVLKRWGLISDTDATALLHRFGYDSTTAEKFLAAEAAKRADAELNAFLTEIAAQRVNNFIDKTTFGDIVDRLPLDRPHKDFYLQAVGQRVEFPRRRLTLAEVQAAFVEGILDLSDVDDWLTKEGYDDLSHQVLNLQTLLKLTKEQETDAVKQFKYNLAVAKAKAKGQPIPPVPPGLSPAPGT